MDTNTLTPEEQAYFESRGETDLPAAKEPSPAPEAAEVDQAADATEDFLDAADVGDEPRQTMVPHKALHAERERRKALEKELTEAREFRIRMEERARWAQEQDAVRTKAAEPPPEPVPDPDEDVFAATRYALRETEALKQRLEQETRASSEESARREMHIRTQAHELEFRKVNPDYDEAVVHLRTVRERELAAMGYVDPGQRAQIITREAWGLAQNALQQGKSPAQVAYEVAQARGYQPKVAQTITEDDGERLDRAKSASRSLSSAGGAPSGPMTAERLEKMSQSEFNAYYAKNPATVNRILNG
jgi:hypothetical protein